MSRSPVLHLRTAGSANTTPTDERNSETVQNVVYEIGKRHQFEPLRDWFGALYEVLLGQTQGPRFGSFDALFGCGETAAMIRAALAGDFLK